MAEQRFPLPFGYHIRRADRSDRLFLLNPWKEFKFLLLFGGLSITGITLFRRLVEVGVAELSPMLIIPVALMCSPLGVWLIALIIRFYLFDWSSYWFVEHGKKIVGVAQVDRNREFTVLESITIVSELRDRGYGSALLAQIIERERKPIFLCCPAPLVKFFAQLGFKPIPRSLLPPELKQKWFSLLLLRQFLVFTPNANLPSEPSDPTAEAKLFLAECCFRPATEKDIPKLRWLVLKAVDLFLPFGINASPEMQVRYLGGVFIALLFVTLQLRDLPFISLVSSLLILVLRLMVALIPFAIVLSVLFGAQNYDQFWTVEFSGKEIAYARCFQYQNFSVLQFLYADPAYAGQEVDTELIKRIVESVKKPIFVAAPYDRSKFYLKLGFIYVFPRALPKFLQFGAKINESFGGKTFVLK